MGERLTAQEAARQGLSVVLHEKNGDPHDIIIAGHRVDAKATMLRADGTWNINLHSSRTSHFGTYSYEKDYARDCDVLAVVALYPEHHRPDFYLFESNTLPSSLTIRLGGQYEARRNDWSLLRPFATIHA